VTSLSPHRQTGQVRSRLRGRDIIASGWIEQSSTDGDFFVTEHIRFADTGEDATPDFYNSLTTAELETIDSDYWWEQEEDLGDEDYESIDHDSSDDEEWPEEEA
jgi:hypothetical protein